jgi:hypothetical protein
LCLYLGDFLWSSPPIQFRSWKDMSEGSLRRHIASLHCVSNDVHSMLLASPIALNTSITYRSNVKVYVVVRNECGYKLDKKVWTYNDADSIFSESNENETQGKWTRHWWGGKTWLLVNVSTSTLGTVTEKHVDDPFIYSCCVDLSWWKSRLKRNVAMAIQIMNWR